MFLLVVLQLWAFLQVIHIKIKYPVMIVWVPQCMASSSSSGKQWKQQWLKQQLQEHHTIYFIVPGPMLAAVRSHLRVHELLPDREGCATQITAGDSRQHRYTLGAEDLAGEENQVHTPTGL